MKKINNRKELLDELKNIYNNGTIPDKERFFALALAYLILDIIPEDRTTKRVFSKNLKRNV